MHDTDEAEPQPPPSSGAAITPYLLESFAELVQRVESKRATDAATETANPPTPAKRDRNTDYATLIGRWLSGVPEADRQHGFRMSELLTVLAGTGRYSEQPASRLIGTALYQAGWTSYRCYKKGSRNARRWKPPLQP